MPMFNNALLQFAHTWIAGADPGGGP